MQVSYIRFHKQKIKQNTQGGRRRCFDAAPKRKPSVGFDLFFRHGRVWKPISPEYKFQHNLFLSSIKIGFFC